MQVSCNSALDAANGILDEASQPAFQIDSGVGWFLVKDSQTQSTAEIKFSVTSEVSDPQTFIETLGRAVNYWLRSTDSGQEVVEAMIKTGRFNFNLYDVAGYLYCPELNSILSNSGISELSICVYGDSDDEYQPEDCNTVFYNWGLRDNLLEQE